MDKVEKFLLEEGVDDLILSCDKDGEWILASDMMRKYSEHQLASTDFNQQRELLECFCKLANITHDTVNKDIEETIYIFNYFKDEYNNEQQK